jgi:hypothetical protein
MTDDTDKFRPEPVEGDRATIERELKRSERSKDASNHDRKATGDTRPVKDFDPASNRGRMFGNGDIDREA